MKKVLFLILFGAFFVSVCKASKITPDSLAHLQQLAGQGNAPAQCNLGICYYNGNGVTKDYTQAVSWFRKAAGQGYTDAQNWLGYCYAVGIGVSKDYTQAVNWYRKTADQGNAWAQSHLGDCYYYGNGVTKDYTQAVSWYRKAANQGNADAQCNLGYCYGMGNGVTKDYTQAVSWYRKAADQGNAWAQNNLGNCYYNGNGVTKNYAMALSLYQKAARNGNANALQNLNLFSKLTETLYRTEESGNYGLISTSGKEILRTICEVIEVQNDGNIKYKTTAGSWGVVNAKGIIIIPANKQYTSISYLNNSSTKYYKVSKGGRYGLTDSEGREIVPCEMEALESAGTGYLKYKINGFWGVMNYAGKIIIDTDRGYTSIGNFLTFTKRFPYTMSGYKGECDATGRQISKIKIETPKQAVATQTTTTPKKQEGEQKIIIEHKHDPVPMQVWKQCQICFGSGTCQACANIIWPSGSDRKCMACGWSRKCQFCAGNGGHYEVEYK